MMMFKLVVLVGIIFSCACGAPLEDIATGNNLFTASIYRELTQATKGNLLLSPFSIDVILALTEAGAKKKTAEEIRTSLNLPRNEAEIQKMFKTVMPLVTGDANFTLNTANKIYLKDDLTLQEGFKKTATDVYQAEVENVDFLQAEEAADIINQWVEEQTDNKIQKLIDPDSLDSSTITVLVNTLYFKGQWMAGFYNSTTRKEPFYTNAREMVQVDMMNAMSSYRNFYEDSVARYLELPFWGNNISMVIALPNEIEGFTTLENKVETVFAPHNFQREEIVVIMPKFKVESTIDLKQPLQNLGVRSLFDPLSADLSGMVNEVDALYVDKIKQKTYIAVDESGVEAAAATYESIAEITSVGPDPLTFLVNRPFLFYIKFNDLILFAGRVITPEM